MWAAIEGTHIYIVPPPQPERDRKWRGVDKGKGDIGEKSKAIRNSKLEVDKVYKVLLTLLYSDQTKQNQNKPNQNQKKYTITYQNQPKPTRTSQKKQIQPKPTTKQYKQYRQQFTPTESTRWL